MRLNSASAEPSRLVHLVPQPPESEALVIPTGVINIAEEPVINASVLMDKELYGNDFSDSKCSRYNDILIILIVVLAHLVLFWCLLHTPHKAHNVSAQQGKKVYQVSLVSDSGAMGHGHVRQTSKAFVASPPMASSSIASHGQTPMVTPHATSRLGVVPKSRRHFSNVHKGTAASTGKTMHSKERPIAQRHLSRQHQGRALHPSPIHASRGHSAIHGDRTQRSTAQRLPSAQNLIQQVVSSATSNGWQEAAQRFAQEPSTNSQRNAIDRYIADFTRAVQTYIDVNLGAEHVANAQMTLYITVSRSGHLLRVMISKSTGYDHLDRLAVRTLYQAGPYRPFDPAMGNIPQLSFSRGWLFGEGSAFRFQ
ncbi:hypothetical protein LMG33818_001574 [Halomonadaceae bacterium LMG 33818]